jgi:hypothetical protein
MKKGFILAAMFASGALSAQITITQSDFGAIGDTYVVGTRSTDILVTPGNGGSNQIWDFRSLSPENLDTIYFLSPAGLPGASSFPNANIATESNDGLFYLRAASNGVFTQGGMVDLNGSLVPAVFQPEQTLLPFTSSFNDSFSSVSRFQLAFAFPVDTTILGCNIKLDSIRNNRHSNLSATFDAWGSIYLAVDTFAALRSNALEVATDSIFVYAPQQILCPLLQINIPQGWSLAPQQLLTLAGIPGPVTITNTRAYTWYANGERFAVASLEVDGNGDPVFARFKSDASQLSVNTPSLTSLNVYPNPAQNAVTISISKPGQVDVSDLSGRKVMSQWINPGTSIDVSKWNDGVYLFQVKHKDGQLMGTGRFIVSH